MIYEVCCSLQGEHDMKQDAFNKAIKRSAGPVEQSVCECVWEAFICTKYEDTRGDKEEPAPSLMHSAVRRRHLLSQPDTNVCSTDMFLNYSGVKGGVPHHHHLRFLSSLCPYYLLHI